MIPVSSRSTSSLARFRPERLTVLSTEADHLILSGIIREYPGLVQPPFGISLRCGQQFGRYDLFQPLYTFFQLCQCQRHHLLFSRASSAPDATAALASSALSEGK